MMFKLRDLLKNLVGLDKMKDSPNVKKNSLKH